MQKEGEIYIKFRLTANCKRIIRSSRDVPWNVPTKIQSIDFIEQMAGNVLKLPVIL
jgi:hypothetical protein